MPRSSRPVTVTLGDMKSFADERIARGRYASVSEVVRAGLRALEREETHLDDWMRERIRESLEDPRPDIPAEEVFAELRARMDAAVKAEDEQH
jgi:antitoxin ParD1/3/4